MKSHFLNIQALRGVAALMVLTSHVWVIEGLFAGTRYLPMQLGIGVVGVDLFFLISGFVMVKVAERMAAKKTPILRFAYDRVLRIYPLYWIATIVAIAGYLSNDLFLGGDPMEGDPLRSFLLLPQSGLPILTVGWTLIHEMYFYLVFFFILALAPKYKAALLVAWGVIVAAANFYIVESATPPDSCSAT